MKIQISALHTSPVKEVRRVIECIQESIAGQREHILFFCYSLPEPYFAGKEAGE